MTKKQFAIIVGGMATPSRLNTFFQNNFKPKSYDWYLLGIVGIISLCGVAFVASAIVTRLQNDGQTTNFVTEFFKQLLLGFWIGGILAFLLSQIDYHNLFRFKNSILLGTFVLLATLSVPIFIARIVGANAKDLFAVFDSFPIRPRFLENAGRWIAVGPDTGGLTFQPAELAKLTLLIYFAGAIQQLGKEGITWDNFKKPFYAFGLTAIMIVIQPDLGSVVMLSVIIGSVLWVSNINLKITFVAITLFILFTTTFIFSVDYRRERFFAWYNNTISATSEEKSTNLSIDDIERFRQVESVKKAVHNGGLLGVGYGKGVYKADVPQVSSDAIIAAIAEEMGFVFTMLFLSLYLVFFFRAMHIASRAVDTGGKALATGIGIWILFQAFWNVAGITGLVPLKGLPLPFISEGGTAIAVNLAAIGILMNVSSQQKIDTLPINKKLNGRNQFS